MGQSKANLKIEYKSLLENTLNHLQGAGCSPLAIAANRHHPLPNYFFTENNIEIAFDTFSNSGPLAGLHSGLGHLMAWSEWALVVPCDLPQLTSQALTSLLQSALNNPNPCPTIVRQGGRANPLLGVLPTAWHHKAGQLLELGQFHADSMLQGEQLRYFDVPADDRTWQDCDTPEEWLAFQNLNATLNNQRGKPV